MGNIPGIGSGHQSKLNRFYERRLCLKIYGFPMSVGVLKMKVHYSILMKDIFIKFSMQMYRTIVDMMNKFQNDHPFKNGGHKTKL